MFEFSTKRLIPYRMAQLGLTYRDVDVSANATDPALEKIGMDQTTFTVLTEMQIIGSLFWLLLAVVVCLVRKKVRTEHK